MKMKEKVKYFFRVVIWMYKHRSEYDCRQKWRRMEKELRGGKRK